MLNSTKELINKFPETLSDNYCKTIYNKVVITDPDELAEYDPDEEYVAIISYETEDGNNISGMAAFIKDNGKIDIFGLHRDEYDVDIDIAVGQLKYSL